MNFLKTKLVIFGAVNVLNLRADRAYISYLYMYICMGEPKISQEFSPQAQSISKMIEFE